MNPIGGMLIVEFLREVFSELIDALKRRRAEREKAAKERADKAARDKYIAEQRDVFQRELWELKKKSKIPENPYGE